MRKSRTLGKGKSAAFAWAAKNRSMFIENEKGSKLKYPASEIAAALVLLFNKFGFEDFPLANNVEKLYKNEEKEGLGTVFYSVRKDTRFAQGSSYLGVILEELEIFEWVSNKERGIHWKLRPDRIIPIGKVVDILQATYD